MTGVVRLRIALAAVAVLSLGVLTVHAAGPCTRLIHEYREKLVQRHKISKETAERWAIWGKEHPNYHPKPKPKEPLSPEETLKKTSFACELPTVASPLSDTMIPELETTEPLDLIASSLEPVKALPPFSLTGIPAIIPTPLDVVDTPEPSSFLLLGTGLACMWFLRSYRRRSAATL